ncbi:DNA repair protein RecN [Ferrimonas sp. SCSIO 43195]|uniref:DNA repair protein RecN n=1 Tax=Ferrimonas sp. SCSIO 43195 TaxID=2822844 RepID=UPI002074E975|nr:DNA repair protein RecN [Ferrimonas sp. SCSIO 43195]USD38438.1 DNA repair protein RecN [Ferrimonas sp. SCSIO 43195]
MLTQLTVSNFAIVKFLELDFRQGMTTITGETGAGKSIAIDALGLCLGARAEAAMVRPGAGKTEISACFDVRRIDAARRWLADNDLDDNDECILRRSISSEGRSKAWINGQPVPLAQLKALGQRLITIHGQHAHQGLLQSHTQLSLLDQYAGHQALLHKCSDGYRRWKHLDNELARLQQEQQQRQARQQLLEYQVQELDEFALEPGEFEAIESEHRRLANCTTLMEQSQRAVYLLSEGEEVSAVSLLQQAIAEVETLASDDKALEPGLALLHEGLIQLQEGANELAHYHQSLELDPQRFDELEQRLSKAMTLARKHQVKAGELAQLHQTLAEELQSLSASEQRLDELDGERQLAMDAYLQAAQRLSKSRQRYAKELNKLVTANLRELALPHAKFQIEVQFDDGSVSPAGGDRIQFQVSTNPGQPLQPLGKVASGGELSRISLAIQVITAKKVSTPTLIFDEVDVGISGPTAAVVGRMLRTLGDATQVFCVTHLPQVAGNGHNHMFVSKSTKGQVTETQMAALSNDDRLDELARLLGGDSITENTLANARELLMEPQPRA